VGQGLAGPCQTHLELSCCLLHAHVLGRLLFRCRPTVLFCLNDATVMFTIDVAVPGRAVDELRVRLNDVLQSWLSFPILVPRPHLLIVPTCSCPSLNAPSPDPTTSPHLPPDSQPASLPVMPQRCFASSRWCWRRSLRCVFAMFEYSGSRSRLPHVHSFLHWGWFYRKAQKVVCRYDPFVGA
jgi:hypothetical protein